MKIKRLRNSSDRVHGEMTGVIPTENEKDVRFRRGTKTKSIVDWCSSSFGSIIIHVFVLLLLFLGVSSRNSGSLVGERETDEIGIVLSDSHKASTLDDDPMQTQYSIDSPANQEVAITMQQLKNVSNQLLPSNEIGLTNKRADFSSVLGDSANIGIENGRTGTNGQGVNFGDVRGNGKSFVYILDRSDSMSWNGAAPMRKALDDAVSSIKSLDVKLGAKKFQVLVYNHDIEIFEQNNELIDVTEPNKTRAIRFLRSLVATGGTQPEVALEAGIKMRPDVIFFLTDADEEMSTQILQSLHSLRVQYKVKQICVVEFGKASAPRKKSYRQLAGENNGTYIFRNIESF